MQNNIDKDEKRVLTLNAGCWKLSTQDLLIDLKVLMKEYYVATFTENEGELKIAFENGQKFIIGIKECS